MRRPIRFYLVGGSVMIDLGLRSATLDIDFAADADDPAALTELEPAIVALKNELDVNVEPASPSDFLPIPAGVRDRSRFVERFGQLDVYYYDLTSLIIAKVARAYEQDLSDAELLVRSGQVSWDAVTRTWALMKVSTTGWLRYEPADIERRLDILRQRLDVDLPPLDARSTIR